jgi:hypothetical protein
MTARRDLRARPDRPMMPPRVGHHELGSASNWGQSIELGSESISSKKSALKEIDSDPKSMLIQVDADPNSTC